MLIFVVARSRLDRYEELRRHFEDWRDVKVVLDRREGQRRTAARVVSGADRRRVERRQRLHAEPYLNKLGWSVVDTDELASQNTVALLADLEDFVHNHRPHGPLTGDATEPAENGYRFTVACTCGMVFERWVTLGDAMDALISWSSHAVRWPHRGQ